MRPIPAPPFVADLDTRRSVERQTLLLQESAHNIVEVGDTLADEDEVPGENLPQGLPHNCNLEAVKVCGEMLRSE